MQYLIMLLFVMAPACIAEEVYVDVDENGTPTFSDQEGPGSRTMKINKPVTFENENLVPVTPRKTDQDEEPEKISYEARITDPEDDAAVRENTGALTLTVRIEPGLMPGHSAALMMDGEKIRGLTGSGPVQLTNVDRGLHRFSIQIVDENGRIIEEGPVTRVAMLRYFIR